MRRQTLCQRFSAIECDLLTPGVVVAGFLKCACMLAGVIGSAARAGVAWSVVAPGVEAGGVCGCPLPAGALDRVGRWGVVSPWVEACGIVCGRARCCVGWPDTDGRATGVGVGSAGIGVGGSTRGRGGRGLVAGWVNGWSVSAFGSGVGG